MAVSPIFVGGSDLLSVRKEDVQRTINVYPVVDESGSGKSRVYLQSIPGLGNGQVSIVTGQSDPNPFSPIPPPPACLGVLLNHFTTALGGMALSAVGPDLTISGSSVIQTSTFKFQGAAGFSPDRFGGFSTASLSVLMTGKSFTAQGWVYPRTYAQSTTQFSFGDGALSTTLRMFTTSTQGFEYATIGGSSSGTAGPLGYNTNAWNWFAHQYSDITGDLTTYINGSLAYTQHVGPGAFAGHTFTQVSCGVFDGYIDEISLCVGSDVDYHGSFVTPPAAPAFPLTP